MAETISIRIDKNKPADRKVMSDLRYVMRRRGFRARTEALRHLIGADRRRLQPPRKRAPK